MNKLEQAIATVAPLPDYFIIDGRRIAIDQRDAIETRDPGSNTPLVAVPAGIVSDIDAAVAAAKRALNGEWAQMAPRERGRLLYAIGEAIRADVDRLGLVESLDTGKPHNEARVTVERTADYFCYYAGIVDKLHGETIPLGPGKVCFTEKVPIGVTGHIVPWNVPVSMVARGCAPALACGNTAVVKPAEDTPLTAILLVELMEKVGLPSGVVNVVTGHGSIAGAALAEHPDVHHVTFTGSVATGKSVMHAAANHLASVTLELGGKSPHVIMADCDLDRAVPDVLDGVYKNAGQICSAGTRVLVERSLEAELTDRLAKTSAAMRVGHGLDNPDMGPLISAKQRATVAGFTERAKERGIEFVAGGSTIEVDGSPGGHYFAPSIAADVPVDDELAQREVFGPVLSLIPFDDLDEAIAIANNTEYGLAAGIHTRDISVAMRYSRAVSAGQVFINGYHGAGDTVPFGGFKDSGIGREKGMAALDGYCETRAITITT
ncbi:MAG: aldehyde dehydrogenase family protein [Pseudomonadota bacterium]